MPPGGRVGGVPCGKMMVMRATSTTMLRCRCWGFDAGGTDEIPMTYRSDIDPDTDIDIDIDT